MTSRRFSYSPGFWALTALLTWHVIHQQSYGLDSVQLGLEESSTCSHNHEEEQPPAFQGRPGNRVRSTQPVLNSRLKPVWYGNFTKFWYRKALPNRQSEFVKVNASTGHKTPAFDHVRLAESLAKATELEITPQSLPFDTIEFVEEELAIRFEVEGVTWICSLRDYVCTPFALLQPRTKHSLPSNNLASDDRNGSGRRGVSPDARWQVQIVGHNIRLKNLAPDPGQNPVEFSLTQDGTEYHSYGRLEWSPDSKTLTAFRIQPEEISEVHLIESSPSGGGKAKLTSRKYALPGDKFTRFDLVLFDVSTQRVIPCEVDPIDFGSPDLRWQPDGHTFTYEKWDRGHQRYRLIEVDTQTGTTRNIIDESSETFIWSNHTEGMRFPHITWLSGSKELIYASERDGWRHLYLVNVTQGSIQNQITRGDFVVKGIDRIDEEHRQIWFRACGGKKDQDPYFIHYYRVNLDGTELTELTDGNGTHEIQFSPDFQFLVDTYSRVDQAPIHELRRCSDGKLICQLETADITILTARGWKAPEVFATKGRDGQTDIWGLICRPTHFDPQQRYPVIEYIYAGPHNSHVPKSFRPSPMFDDLTSRGFIVVQMDGMGTANRSKSFHDVCWKNLKDAGFPDRILWHQAVAAKYSWYDTSRVGIYGVSAGGQNATGALLFHPDFYKAGVAGCGCHDNRMDKASWNEQWMGFPVGPHYAACSNIDNAHRLQGKLLLIVGELDTNVPPESTYRLVDALIKANKEFDFVMVPGAGHGIGGAFGVRKMQEFFLRHLQGKP